jgi:hypothetical protein
MMRDKGQGTRDKGVARGQWPVARLGAALRVANESSTLRVPSADPDPRPPTPDPCRRRRHAITLLEVLMSMFVLAVGLLSVASLLPVGSFQAARALIDDRKAVLGQNAAREAKTRGVLRPDWWWYANGSPYVTQTSVPRSVFGGGKVTIPAGTITVNPATPTQDSFGSAVSDPAIFGPGPSGGLSTNSIPLTPVCVDPWMFNMGVRNGYTAQVDLFASGGNNSPLRMPRVTLVQNTAGVTQLTAAQQRSSFCNDQSFVSEDDLSYVVDQSNPDTPPARGFNGNGLPILPSGGPGNGTKRNYNGQFTWLATIVPLYGDGVQLVNRNLAMLSIVTFNQRVALPTTPPAGVTERAALAVFKPLSGGINTWLYPPGKQQNDPTAAPTNNINKNGSTGISAAEIQLVDLSRTAATTADADLIVKPGEWIMLATMITEYNQNAPAFKDVNGKTISQSDPWGWDNSPMPPTPPTPPSRPMFRWYRVVSAGPLYPPGQGGNTSKFYVRDVTISGPEWDFSTVAAPNVKIGADGNGTPIFARDPKNNNHALFFAFIYDGAVAVYERTVRLEGPSMWSN